jgi:hypothetical protein
MINPFNHFIIISMISNSNLVLIGKIKKLNNREKAIISNSL